ncbi:MAG TPA: PIN domain-containing protein [Kofleriaceae bacterium]|nr:PIN domain-containing protein [Kofleriaceae bacterium]
MSLTLDSGALIAFERGDRMVIAIVRKAAQAKEVLAVPAGVVGQVWRDGRRQVALARLLSSDLLEIEGLDDELARKAGQLCGMTGSSDVIDASVVLCARARDHAVLTSDPEDIARLGPELRIIAV